MSHFAQIDENNRVQQVIVAEQNFIDSAALGNPAVWIQTSYNTSGGVHSQGGTPLRKNYAAVGMIYDATRDAFYWPQPTDSGTWVFDEFSCTWQRPVPKPDAPGYWLWNEATQNWVVAL